jgi:hypothetical protein
MRICIENGIEPDINGFYTMRMDYLTEKLKYTPNKKELWNDLEALKNQTVAVNFLMKDGKPASYGAGYISEWVISNAFLKFKFPTFFLNVARNFIEYKKLFLELNWDVFNSLTGKYEAIIYKLCRDYMHSGGKRTPNFTIESFREYVGVKPHEYSDFKAFNRRCIKEPVEMLNKNALSDIVVEIEYIKSKKTVIGLFFKIESKQQLVLAIDLPTEENPFNSARIPIAPIIQKKYLQEHTPEEAKQCIEAANEWIEAKVKAGEPVVYGRVYRKALEENWQPNKPNIEKQKKTIEAKKIATVAVDQEKETARLNSLALERQETQKLSDGFKTLSESKKKDIIIQAFSDSEGKLKIYLEKFQNNQFSVADIRILVIECKKKNITFM